MKVTFSDTVDDFSISGLVEYNNKTATRMALATVSGDSVHVLHELTSCRDNLASMLCVKYFNLVHEEAWYVDEETVAKTHNAGGCMSLEDDVYALNSFGLVLYTNAHEKLPSVVDKLQHYANIADAIVPFQLTDLGDYSKYGGHLWLITGDKIFNQPWLHSFIAFALRFHLERSEEELITDLDTIKIYGDAYCDDEAEGLSDYWIDLVKSYGAHRYAVKRMLRSVKLLGACNNAARLVGSWFGFASTAKVNYSKMYSKEPQHTALVEVEKLVKECYGMEG